MLKRQHRFSNSFKKGCQLRIVIIKPNKVVQKHIGETLFQTDNETVFDFGKTCFLIVDDLIGHAQFRSTFNVWRSKVSTGTCMDCLK